MLRQSRPGPARMIATTPQNEVLATGVVSSPVGLLRIAASERGVVECGFVCAAGAQAGPRPGQQFIEQAARELAEYFAGERRGFTVPLDLRGTEFQLEAWRGLLTIPFGTTVSYVAQAAQIGRPRAVRAVGAANGANPIAVIVPCHRVLASDGSLHGYGGGLDKKRWLLEHEGALAPQ